MAGGLDIGRVIGIITLATVLLIAVNQVVVKQGGEYTFDPSGFDTQPIFLWLTVGIGIYISYLGIQKFTGTSTSAKDLVGLAIAAGITYFLWKYMLGPYVFDATVIKLFM